MLILTNDQLAELSADDGSLLRLLAAYLPELMEFDALCRLPERERASLQPLSPHLTWAIPGRKWSQIQSFAQSIGPVQQPLLEWCGGKGHLGRLLAAQWQQPVITLEHGAELCAEGEALAQRARIEQHFEVVDVLTPAAVSHLPGRHAVALHACGELHRTLLRQAVAARLPAIDIAPCCYHLGGGESYHPFSAMATLQLTPDDLRLAVTETVTSAPREVRKRDQEMAWKLGFDQLRRDCSGDDIYHPIRPIEKPWLNLSFSEFCKKLAQREGVVIVDECGWSHYEVLGWQRQHEVMCLSLVRKALRRPLELWLVFDMANYLNEQGYIVTLGTFCDRQVTPRNLLLSAKL